MTKQRNTGLSYEKTTALLKTKCFGRDLHIFEKVTSTFDKAKELNLCHGSVVCALSQTNGRGRLGRQWHSDDGGIYFSLIISPEGNTDEFGLYTALCALGVQRALSEYIDCYIKWPNDIVTKDGKKLCGILAKLEFCHGQAGMINIGIGINANTDDFDPSLPYASSLKRLLSRELDENEILASALYEIEKCAECKNREKLIDEFSKVCITLNSKVRAIYTNNEEIRGTAKSVQTDGALVIEKEDGTLVSLNWGEVSVRGIYGENYV